MQLLSLNVLTHRDQLMFDTTGLGWDAHMGFGTSVLLRAFGPSTFCSTAALCIYREIRLFEITRAALFSRPTLLAKPHWLLHDLRCRDDAKDWSVLEIAFDMFLQCSILSQRFV